MRRFNSRAPSPGRWGVPNGVAGKGREESTSVTSNGGGGGGGDGGQNEARRGMRRGCNRHKGASIKRHPPLSPPTLPPPGVGHKRKQTLARISHLNGFYVGT
ncbi:hypothetical protein M0804_009422 [Polistes exclamans]|nr:hypothetical protein M0804_009422 [Polistes exclamans]